MRCLLVAAILASSAPALADAPGVTAPVVIAEPLPPPPRKTFAEAYAITVGATAGPILAFGLMAGDDPKGTFGTVGGILATTALVIGPSAGHWYAGSGWTTGLTLRLTGAGMIGGLAVLATADRADLGTVIVGGLAALAVFETGMIWDLVTLPRAVRRANRERSIAVAPYSTGQSSGLAIVGSF